MPLGNPSVSSSLSTPLMSCPFNPPSVSPSPLPLLLTLFSRFQTPSSQRSQKPGSAVLPPSFVSFVSGGLPVSSASASLSISPLQQACNFLMSTPPSPPLLAPLSIIPPQCPRVVSLFIATLHCVASQQHARTPGTIKNACPCTYKHIFTLPPSAPTGLLHTNCKNTYFNGVRAAFGLFLLPLKMFAVIPI